MAKPKGEGGGGRSRFQRFDTQEVHRSRLANAPYNPRVITEKQKKKLRRILEKVGLVAPITWNRRSGNIVGGHRRIEALDALEGTKDYTLTVAVVDLDEKAEKEANVALNNQGAQGDFDLEKLGVLFKDDKLDLDATGYDLAEMYQLFGESPFAERPEAIEKMASTLAELQATSRQLATAVASREDPDFYHVIVHRTYEDRVAYGRLIGLADDNRYLDGRMMADLARENEELRARLGLPPRRVPDPPARPAEKQPPAPQKTEAGDGGA